MHREDKVKRVVLIRYIFVLFIFPIFAFSACISAPRPFDSEQWKAGNASIRGSMVDDTLSKKLLIGKTKAEISELLGKAEHSSKDWVGYDVVTNSRCYFWNCRLEINFDPESGRVVEDPQVSN